MKLNFQKLDIEIPVEIPVNFMISTGTGIPANRLILTGTGILPGSRSILVYGNIVFRQILITLNSVMNPFIFLWRMPEFRQKVISMKVFQPLYATFSKHCCKTGQIESRVDEKKGKNNVNNNKLQNKFQLKVAQNKPHSIIHSNLRNNRKNDPTNLPGNMEDNSPVPYRNTLSIMATSSHLSSAETTSRKMPEINDSELYPLGPVIVHRSAIDLD